MRSKIICALFFAGLLVWCIKLDARDFPKSIQKKIDKALKQSFNQDELQLADLEVNDDAFHSYTGVQNLSFSTIHRGSENIGLACFASSKGKFELFDYLVLFDTELVIKKVVVLVYRSSYGGEIMTKYWLKQFEGKSRGEQLEFNKDIDGISGATISGPSITNGVKQLSRMVEDLKKSGAI